MLAEIEDHSLWCLSLDMALPVRWSGSQWDSSPIPIGGVSDEIDPIFWHLMAYSIRRDQGD